MSEFLNQEIKEQVKEVLAALKHPVQILLFTTPQDCDTCSETRQLLEEVCGLSPLLGLSVYDLSVDAAIASEFRVDKAPMFVIASKSGDKLIDTGVQFAGLPSGHEFTTLIHDLILVSGGDSGLNEATRKFLQDLTEPIHLQVFVTPTCPYCPRAVLLAHQMALENPLLVRAEGVESMEFQDLAERFFVSGVPQTTVNAGAGRVVGAVPESTLLAELARVMA